MASQAQSGPRFRNTPFGRTNGTPSPGPPPGHARSRSTVVPTTMSPTPATHARHQSFAELGMGSLERSDSRRGSIRSSTPATGTFAQKFIKTEALDGTSEKVGGIEGENDFSGKRYVWVKDPQVAFVRGWVVEDLPNGFVRVQCDDGSVSISDYICTTPHADKTTAERCRL